MPGRGRGVHQALKDQYKPRDRFGQFVSGHPRGPIRNFRRRSPVPTVDPIEPKRISEQSPPIAKRISLSPPGESHIASFSDLDVNPEFGTVPFYITGDPNAPELRSLNFPAEDFASFEINFNRKQNTAPPPPPLPPPDFLRSKNTLRTTPRNNNTMASIDTIRAMIPKCDDELKNLAAFIGMCDRLHRKIRVEDRPMFCLMVLSRASESSLYDLVKDLPDEATWEDVKTALSTETTPPMSRTAAQAQISNLKQKNSESMQDYAKRARAYLRQLNEAVCVEATTEETKKFVKVENERIAKRAFEDGIFSSDLRMYTRTLNKKNLADAIEEALDNEARMVPVRPITTCSHCKKAGHVAENCFTKKNEQKTCNICKLKGHTEEHCRKRNATKETPRPADSTAENKNAHITCNYCKEKGHYANECPKRSVPPKAVKFAQRVDVQQVEDTPSEMEYVADRFAVQAQIHPSENFYGQNA